MPRGGLNRSIYCSGATAKAQLRYHKSICLFRAEKIKGKIHMEGQLHPRDKLGIARTVLANQRTLLAVIRTALGSFIGGAGLIKFFGHPAYEIVGIMLMIISAIILFIGIRKHRSIKKLISNIDPEDWQALEPFL
jgi:putative membrane protein